MPFRLPVNFEKSQRLSNQVSYLVLTVMMLCVSITFVQFFQWITRGAVDFQWDYLPFFVFLVALESIYTRPIARELDGREKIIYHAAEWITFIVILKIIHYANRGFDQLFVDLPRWQSDFIFFFEGDFFFSILLLVYVWFISRFSADNLDELNADPTDIFWDAGQIQNNRLNVRGALVSRLLWTGTIIVALAATTHINMSAVLGPDASQGPVINILVYFFLALILFSQIQFALLRGRWFWHQTPIASILTGQWIRYSLLFFAILAVISFLLPTNYSMGLLETLNIVLNWLISALFFLVQLILLPIIWLLSIAGCSRQPDAQPSITAAPPYNPPVKPPLSVQIPWLELLQSILFWGLFIAIVFYSLVQFARQNPQIVYFLKRFRIFNWTGTLLRWLRNWFAGTRSQISGWLIDVRRYIFSSRISNLTRQIRPWINFRQLSTRQQIIYFYLRLIERGSEYGLKRQISQTPNQYAQTLEANIPEVQSDIAAFTDTFMEARYSQHTIEPDQASLVQRFWRNITRSLKRVHSSPRDNK